MLSWAWGFLWQDNQLIKEMLNGILITNVISMVSGVGCVMVDAIVTGQFLGTDAVAATGLIQPVIMLINLVGGAGYRRPEQRMYKVYGKGTAGKG